MQVVAKKSADIRERMSSIRAAYLEGFQKAYPGKDVNLIPAKNNGTFVVIDGDKGEPLSPYDLMDATACFARSPK